MSGPCVARSRSTTAAAGSVISTRWIMARSCMKGRAEADLRPFDERSEETERLRRVAYQQVLGLLIVVEHHLVVFASDARLLVPAERGVSGIGVEAVRPHAARLNRAAHAIGAIAVARPYAGAKPVKRVVGDREGFRLVLQCRHRDDRSEYFLLEDAHLVVAGEDRRLDVVAVGELTFESGSAAT